MFIVFEGINGAGKTTLSKKLFDWFMNRNKPVVLVQEPGSITKILKDKEVDPTAEALIYLADRVNRYKKFVEPALNQGKIVISDRYNYSTIAYQLFGKKAHLNKELVQKVLPKVPNVVFYLSIPTVTSRERSPSDLDRDYLDTVNKAYEWMNDNKGYLNMIKIDATLSIDEVFKQITEYLEKEGY